ncbi:MAG: MBL fold metallo-hydrolase [Pirellulaceae bacterium]|nr:MBL fold metallo-hydrolase [Pirellulaceae bacterium]
MELSGLAIKTVVSSLFDQNAYVVAAEGSSECLIIDPGFDFQKAIDQIVESKWQPVAILNTHGHSDHIAGNEPLKRLWPEIPLFIGEKDAHKLTDPQLNLSAQFGLNLISPPADKTLKEGETVDFGGISLKIFETPGHSPGHIIFVWEGPQKTAIFGGDVLFHRSIGRTDFADGNHQDLLDSIRNKLFCYPDETVVFSGHGPTTTIGDEKKYNPFVGLSNENPYC